MGRMVFRFFAVLVGCLVIVVAWEMLIRVSFYSIYYRLFDYSEAISIDYSYSGYVSAPAYDSTYSPAYDRTYSESINRITKSQSTDIQLVAKPFLEELEKKSDYELIILKTADDVCNSGIVFCGVIDNRTAKQFVEVMYSRMQFLAAREDQRFYNKIAVGGLMIGLLSLLVALTFGVLQLRVKRNA